MDIELLSENYFIILFVIGSIISSLLPIFIFFIVLRAVKGKKIFSIKLKNGNNLFSNTTVNQPNNINNFSANPQATKIGNGIDYSPFKKITRWIVGLIFLIILLGILYYILVNFLGMSISIG